MINKDLIKVYAYTKAIFNNFIIPTDELQKETQGLVWLNLLKPYSLEIIYSAINQYAKTNNFVNISQIAELCQELQDISNGTYQTAENYLKEIEFAVSKAGTYESANNAYNGLSDFLKPLIPGYWTLGKWHNEGFEYVATRLKQEIKDKMRRESMQQSLPKNLNILSIQSRTVIGE